MSDDRQPPPLGGVDLNPDRLCSRWVSGSRDNPTLCQKPAVKHVDWGAAAGFICADHLADLERWSYEAVHDLGAECGMPGALWFNGEWDGRPFSWCTYSGDGLPAAEPVRVVSEPVLASAALPSREETP